MALKSWPSTPPSWLLPWTIWRYRGANPATRPPGVPKEIPKYAWEFLKWTAWRRKGALPPRPDIAPKIPQWAWNLLKQLNIAVPIAPPPPPPPPSNPIPANSWKLRNPLIFTAWGWQINNWTNDLEVNKILQKWIEAEIKTVALQIGMFPDNIPDKVREYGFDLALWGEAASSDAAALEEAEAQGYIPQIEGIYQYQNTINNLEAGVGEGLSLSTVTTLAGLETFARRPNGTPEGESTTVEVERLIDAGLTHAFVECYTGNMVPLDVSNFMWSAGHRGIYHADPVLGLARPGVVSVSSYQPDIDSHGKQFGIYLAEPMIDTDYLDIKNLG